MAYAVMDRWHFKMINDRQRNEAYFQAVSQAVQSGDVSSVLDIGCGTGLLG
jgi:type II protein arginine methyltransferase